MENRKWVDSHNWKRSLASGDNNSRLLHVPNSIKQNIVAFLVRERGRWNEDLIKNLFNIKEAETILKIPLPNQFREDEVIENKDKKGVFSVKSDYRLGMDLQNSHLASSSTMDKQ